MDVLGISPLQLLTIVVVAYIFLGPKRMGETGRALGKGLRQLRRYTAEFTTLLMEDEEEEEAKKRSEPPPPEGSVARPAQPQPTPVEETRPVDEETASAQPVAHSNGPTDRE